MKIENMFFEFRFVEYYGDKFEISNSSAVVAEKDCYALKYAKNTLANASGNKTVKVSLITGIPQNLADKIGDKFSENDVSHASLLFLYYINTMCLIRYFISYTINMLAFCYSYISTLSHSLCILTDSPPSIYKPNPPYTSKPYVSVKL